MPNNPRFSLVPTSKNKRCKYICNSIWAALILTAVCLLLRYRQNQQFEIKLNESIQKRVCNPKRWWLKENHSSSTLPISHPTAIKPNVSRIRPQCMRTWTSIPNRCHDFDKMHNTVKREIEKFRLTDGKGELPNAISFQQDMDSNFLHIPHFCVAFFHFFSIALSAYDSQATLYDTAGFKFDHFIVENIISKELLLAQDGKHAWVKDLLAVLEEFWGVNTVISSTCTANNPKAFKIVKWPEIPYSWAGWFFHPADALLLGSMNTKTDPCMFHNKANDILQKDINVVIISRKYDRSVLNSDQIAEFIENNMNDHEHRRRYSKLTVVRS